MERARRSIVATAVISLLVSVLVPVACSVDHAGASSDAPSVAAAPREPAPVGAQPDDASRSEDLGEVPDGVGSIIGPPPGQGVEPTDAGDRGGALQIATFGLVVAGVAAIGALVVRDARRSRRS